MILYNFNNGNSIGWRYSSWFYAEEPALASQLDEETEKSCVLLFRNGQTNSDVGQKSFPAGVGRVVAWWNELTGSYIGNDWLIQRMFTSANNTSVVCQHQRRIHMARLLVKHRSQGTERQFHRSSFSHIATWMSRRRGTECLLWFPCPQQNNGTEERNYWIRIIHAEME